MARNADFVLELQLQLQLNSRSCGCSSRRWNELMYLGQLLMKNFFGLSGADSFRGMYVLRSLKLNRMYQLTSIDSDTFKASGENVQLKSLELSNNEKLQPLPWGIFR